MSNCRGKNTKDAYHVLIANLRILRKKNRISVEEVAAFLASHGVYNNVKTIYGWENGIGTPSFDTILLLCRFYGIKDIFQLSEIEVTEENMYTLADGPVLNEEEKRLILAYRERPEYHSAIQRLLFE